MTSQEKKQLREIISKIEDAQADISLMLMQEEDRLDSVGNGASQIERAIKLEENVDNLESAEELLGDAITSLEQILE